MQNFLPYGGCHEMPLKVFEWRFLYFFFWNASKWRAFIFGLFLRQILNGQNNRKWKPSISDHSRNKVHKKSHGLFGEFHVTLRRIRILCLGHIVFNRKWNRLGTAYNRGPKTRSLVRGALLMTVLGLLFFGFLQVIRLNYRF